MEAGEAMNREAQLRSDQAAASSVETDDGLASAALPADPRPEDAAALARLRETLIASEPLVAPELVQAGSIVELERSFTAAKAAAQRARDMTIAASAPRISSGAPGRTLHAPITPFEKIRTGLQSRP